jgi:hypothetical protein
MNILFFDYWDKGLPVLINSLNYYKDKYLEKISMVHLDSFFRKDFVLYRNFQGIDIYDISFFKEKNLSEIIDLLKPTHIIITNLKLYERIICIIANKKEIPVIYFLHGNIGQIFLKDDFGTKYLSPFLKVISLLKNLRLIKKYFKIYQKFYYPEYVLNNKKDNLNSRKKKFLIFLLNKLKNRFYDFELVEFSEDYFIDCCIVYSNKDVEFLNSTKVNIREFQIKGNFELVTNINNLKNNWIPKNQILIVDDGFTSFNLYGFSPNKMKKIINEVILAFSNHVNYGEYEVVLKIKSQEPTNFESLGINCRIVRDEHIYKCIQESKLIIGTHSTALQYAIFDRKPILIMKWPEYSLVPDVYFQYGIGNLWIDKSLIPEVTICHDKYDKFIADFNLDGKTNLSLIN